MNTDRLNEFCRVYAEKLKEAHATYPDDYGFRADALPTVTGKMIAAIERGSFNKDGHAFKATCKALGIAHTYKAINTYLERVK